MIRNVESRNILQGLFNKWQGKDKEVINEAKVEDVQTIVKMQPTKLYNLTFVHSYKNRDGRLRLSAYFGEIYLCPCYEDEKEMIEEDFNYLKSKGYDIIKIKDTLSDKYVIDYSQRLWGNKSKKRGVGRYTTNEYSFIKIPRSKRVEFKYRVDKKLEKICNCENDDKTKSNIVKECRGLVNSGKTKDEIISDLKPKYAARNDYKLPNNVDTLTFNPTFENEEQIPLKWDKGGRLLFYGEPSGITPYGLRIICSLHANSSNPFTFGDYVLQNLPKAKPSAVFYICENYETIPFKELCKEGEDILENLR